ncbi:MAG TPA: PLDc N-terminal domain-containing protein [Blastocatellia bacterium]|nr:PLDc N-terminal domain-containing protein [Blastocatellia bacterium]
MNTFIWLAAVILDIFAINDVMNSRRDWATKVVLVALILLLPFIGSGLYLFAFRDKGYSV